MQLKGLPAGNRTHVLWITKPVHYHWATEPLPTTWAQVQYTCIIITAIITRAQSLALIFEFGFFGLILNMRLAYFGPEDLATQVFVALAETP